MSDVARFIRTKEKNEEDVNDIPIFIFIKDYLRDYRYFRQFGKPGQNPPRRQHENVENAATVMTAPAPATGPLFESEVLLAKELKQRIFLVEIKIT